MADYPTSVKNFLILEDGVDKVIAAHPNDRAGEITAIQTMLGSMGAAQTTTESFKGLLLGYIEGVKLEYASAATLTIKAGEIAIPDASNNVHFRRNTADITIDWGDIDTGAEGNDTYYVYVVADATSMNFLGVISLSDTLPAGYTFYRRIGSFVNNTDISQDSVTDDNERNSVKFGTPDINVYSAAAPTSLTDLDLSAYVGANKALVHLEVKSPSAGRTVAFRTNGESLTPFNSPTIESTNVYYITLMTDANGIIEWKSDSTSTINIVLKSYVKA